MSTVSPPPVSQDQALRYLTGTLGYTWSEAVDAVNGAAAAEDSTYQLARHQVRWARPGVYFITEAPDPHAAGCCHEPEGREIALAPGYEPGPGEYESWYPHLSSGAARTDETPRPDVHDHEEHRKETGMTREQAAEELRRLGWAEDLLLIMTNLAARDGTFWLDEHTALSCTDGSYQIRARRQAGCCHEPGQAAGARDGHALSRDQIAKHGTDRYPTPGAQYAKLLDEAGELGEALIGWAGTEAPECLARVRAEYADTGLALYALGDKLGLDLIQCMADLVAADTRRFT